MFCEVEAKPRSFFKKLYQVLDLLETLSLSFIYHQTEYLNLNYTIQQKIMP